MQLAAEDAATEHELAVMVAWTEAMDKVFESEVKPYAYRLYPNGVSATDHELQKDVASKWGGYTSAVNKVRWLTVLHVLTCYNPHSFSSVLVASGSCLLGD